MTSPEAQCPTVSGGGILPVGGDSCQRCRVRVYPMERVGPVNEVLFHRRCFTCHSCGQHLSLKTYFTNPNDSADKEVYCSTHYPRMSTYGFDAKAVFIRSAICVPNRGVEQNSQVRGTGETPRVGFDALHIQTPMTSQNQFERKYVQKGDKYHFPASMVNLKEERLYKSQKDLELLQRVEEDHLMQSFRQKRQEEATSIKQEVDEEWQERLKQLTDKYTKSRKNRNKTAGAAGYELEREALRTTMTMKMQKKKEALSLRLAREQQSETSTLVQRHSRQMLHLIKAKQEELRAEIQYELGSAPDEEKQEKLLMLDAFTSMSVPSRLPPPHPPRGRKRDLYYDPIVFAELDQEVFMVAETEQSSFTDLVKQLTLRCQNDLEKARAIFRWITVKNLNVMEFEETLEQDTPLGILRGIKYGTETYHTLFLRLCSYAGLASVEVQGHSKSVGYEPGMRFESGTFLNTWNAVLIYGDWWPVQCNWGARHLVLNKDTKTNKSRQDKIHYEYDEHYFLTDPDEFTQEFWATDRQWQLLDRPISLEEFEDQPFVRSVFFHCGLEFHGSPKAVLITDPAGGTEVRIDVPEENSKELVFHYQLRLVDSSSGGSDLEYNGDKLERYVFHAVDGLSAFFSVRVPAVGSYHLEIFTTRMQGGGSDNRNDSTGGCSGGGTFSVAPSFRLKCSCKFRIVCRQLTSGRMKPLPECVAGEWGPAKAARNLGMEPLTHPHGVIHVDADEVEINFRCSVRFQVQCRLQANEVDPGVLDDQVRVVRQVDGIVRVRLSLAEPGQYGLDIFVRQNGAPLQHACKYLLNCCRVRGGRRVLATESGAFLHNSQEPQYHTHPSKPSPGSKYQNQLDTWKNSEPDSRPPGQLRGTIPGVQKCLGPTQAFEGMGLKAISHPNPTIEVRTSGTLCVIFGLTQWARISGRLRRRPDSSRQDLADRVSAKDSASSSKKIKFLVDLSGLESGPYSFEVFVKTDNEPIDLYNYVINYQVDDVSRSSMGLFSL